MQYRNAECGRALHKLGSFLRLQDARRRGLEFEEGFEALQTPPTRQVDGKRHNRARRWSRYNPTELRPRRRPLPHVARPRLRVLAPKVGACFLWAKPRLKSESPSSRGKLELALDLFVAGFLPRWVEQRIYLQFH